MGKCWNSFLKTKNFKYKKSLDFSKLFLFVLIYRCKI
jgi:hypothetical protein